jgi:guanine nucleotide-binding protein alpha-1 subunit
MASTDESRSQWPPSPPPDRNEAERLQRVERETEAKRVSDSIDQDIAEKRASTKRVKLQTKILLLGA